MLSRRPSSRRQFDVVVVGGANTDYLVRGPRLPESGETVQGSIFVPADAGGKGANQAVAAARLGARVAFVGCVGADARGTALLRRLTAEGVAVQHVAIDKRAATGVALINVDEDGEKQILVAPGANLRFSANDVIPAAALIQSARILMLQFEIPLKANFAAAKLARRHNTLVLLDPAPAVRAPKQLLRLVSVIRPNEHEAEALTGVKVGSRQSARKAARLLLAYGIRFTVLAAGKGNLAVWRDDDGHHEELWLPNLPVKTIDATGAGDAFAAGLAVALAEGRTVNEAAVFANAAAALTTTKLGAQPALPTRLAVLKMLRRTGKAKA